MPLMSPVACGLWPESCASHVPQIQFSSAPDQNMSRSDTGPAESGVGIWSPAPVLALHQNLFTQRKPKTQGNRNEDQAAGQENGGQQSTLFQTKHFTRNSAIVADDIVLGPLKLSDVEEISAPVNDDVAASDRMNIREKHVRGREKNGNADTRRGGREDGEVWNGRQRRIFS
ncbi:hypothetical protein K490DRAFT_59046 [Saccharata proteae CBS 121410]|uniref:Uncharacterized protein n=1 Tax=Saccharata proteae CBS 121410 TaxID=1314787 RepID=A0A9P4HNP9_9PEZI|nr:hypothetical protein K490DRAFT_59046 [Saccharata proteae CBS 121410]